MQAKDVMVRVGGSVRFDEALGRISRRVRQEGLEDVALAVLTDDGVLAGVLLPERLRAYRALAPEELTDISASDVMRRGPRVIGVETTLGEATGILLEEGFRHLPVVDENERLVGMLSDRDLRMKLGTHLHDWYRGAQLDETVDRAMTFDPITVREDTPLARILDTFEDEKVGALPVVDEDEMMVGIISYVDVLDWLRRNLEVGGEARASQAGAPKADAPEVEGEGIR